MCAVIANIVLKNEILLSKHKYLCGMNILTNGNKNYKVRLSEVAYSARDHEYKHLFALLTGK